MKFVPALIICLFIVCASLPIFAAAPSISNISPADTETNVSRRTHITFSAGDEDGIDNSLLFVSLSNITILSNGVGKNGWSVTITTVNATQSDVDLYDGGPLAYYTTYSLYIFCEDSNSETNSSTTSFKTVNQQSLIVLTSCTQYTPESAYAGQTNVLVMGVMVSNSNSGLSDRVAYFQGIHLTIYDNHTNQLNPDDVIRKWEVRRTGGSSLATNSIIESSGYLNINFSNAGIYISNRQSVHVDISVSFVSNFAASISNTFFEITLKTNIYIVDQEKTNERVTNEMVSGYSVPFQTGVVALLAQFVISNDALIKTGNWGDIILRGEYANGKIFTNISSNWRIILDTDGTDSTLNWSIGEAAGTLTNDTPAAGSAVYYFDISEDGRALLDIANTTVETLYISVSLAGSCTGQGASPIDFYADPIVTITKSSFITNNASYLALGGTHAIHDKVNGAEVTYSIIVSNAGPDRATNVIINDTLPSDVNYVSGSIQLDAVSKTDAADSDEATIAAGVITVTINKLNAQERKHIVYRARIK